MLTDRTGGIIIITPLSATRAPRERYALENKISFANCHVAPAGAIVRGALNIHGPESKPTPTADTPTNRPTGLRVCVYIHNNAVGTRGNRNNANRLYFTITPAHLVLTSFELVSRYCFNSNSKTLGVICLVRAISPCSPSTSPGARIAYMLVVVVVVIIIARRQSLGNTYRGFYKQIVFK